MKNLKKVLSLALAFAMVLGLCIGASAAQDLTTLKDWDEVENKNAATILGAFNIMSGDTDGNFRPNDNVTRAEAAKMLAVALWGGDDNKALYAGGNAGNYTDIPSGAWYTGYVNFLTVKGVMAGKGDGIFDPEGDVTGYELLKMCLVALGYDPAAKGNELSGAGWDLRTMSLATTRGQQNLTAGAIEITAWNNPINRMNSAIVISNMIKRNMVTYNTNGQCINVTETVTVSETVVDSEGNSTTTSKEVQVPVTFGTGTLSMVTKTGTLVANEYGSIGTVSALTEDDKGNAKMNNGEEDVIITVNSGFGDLGLPVTAYYAGNTFLYAAMNEVAAIAPTVDPAKGVTNVADSYSLIKNGAAATTVSTTPGTALFAELVANAEVKCYSLKLASKGKIDTVIVNTVTPTEVTGVAESEKYGTVILTGNATWNEKSDTKDGATLTNKLINCDFEAKKGDFVAIAATKENVNGEKATHGYVMEAVEGKVTRASTADNGVCKTIYIDGVKYSNTVANTGDGAVSIASNGTFYLYSDGKTVGAFKGVTLATADKYALIYDVGYVGVTGTDVGEGSSFTAKVAAVLPDGTDKAFTVKNFVSGTTDTTAAAPTKGTFDEKFASFYETTGDTKTKKANEVSLMRYTLNEDGTINLYVDQTASDAIDAEVKITKGNAITTGGALMGKDTVTFVQTSAEGPGSTEKWAVYTGMNIEDVTIAATAIAVADGKTFAAGDTYSYIVAKKAEASFGTTTTDVYVTVEAPYLSTKTDGTGCKEVHLYQMSTGKLVTAQFDTNDSNVAPNTFYTSIGVDGKPTGAGITAANSAVGYITNFENNAIRVAMYEDDSANAGEIKEISSKTYVFITNSKTTYHLIDGEDSKTITAADVEIQPDHTTTKYEVVVVTDKAVATGNTAQQVFIFKTAVTGTAPSVGTAAGSGR